MTLKIEKVSDERGTTLRLIGRIRVEHLEKLKAQVQPKPSKVALDLDEVSLVDVDVVRFLGACEAEGVELRHCRPYIREWISRECGVRSSKSES